MRDPKRVMASTTLVMEGLVVLFAALVAMRLTGLGTGRALALGGGVALACWLAAGMLRSRAGYVLGWVLQVVVVASAVVVPAMLVVGGVFAALWWTSLSVGERIERERAAVARGLAERGPGERGADERGDEGSVGTR